MIELHNDIQRFIDHTVDEIKGYFVTLSHYEFCKYDLGYGRLYVVYESKIRFIAKRLAGYETEANGIIFEKNKDYIYYNFDEDYEKKEEIMEEFVKRFIWS